MTARFSSRPLPLTLALACAAFAMGGCTKMRGHSGYIVDTELVNSVQPGTDTRQSVQAVLGRPTFTGQFSGRDGGDWYYLARDTRSYAFATPKVSDQITLKITFDQAGTVQTVTRMDEKQVAAISPSSKVTPTLGRQRSFFEELFGNIGAVGAPGMGGTGGGNRDDTP